MPIGMESYLSNGNLQYSTDFLSYYIRKTGTVNTAATGFGTLRDVVVPGRSSYPNALVGFSGPNGYSLATDLNGSYTAGYWNFVTDAPSGTTWNYFIMETSDNLPDAHFGLQLYNSSGQCTFSAAQYVTRGLNLLSGDRFGFSSPVTYTGRVLGFVPTAFCGWNFYDDPPSGDSSSYYHQGGFYGGTLSNSNQTLTMTAFTYEDREVIGTRPPATNQYDVPGTLIVFDTLNVPIGTTFF